MLQVYSVLQTMSGFGKSRSHVAQLSELLIFFAEIFLKGLYCEIDVNGEYESYYVIINVFVCSLKFLKNFVLVCVSLFNFVFHVKSVQHIFLGMARVSCYIKAISVVIRIK